MEELKPYSAHELYNMTKKVNYNKVNAYVRYWYKIIMCAVERGHFTASLNIEKEDCYNDISEYVYDAINKIKEIFPGIGITLQSDFEYGGGTPWYEASWQNTS